MQSSLFIFMGIMASAGCLPTSFEYKGNSIEDDSHFRGLKYKLCGRRRHNQAIKILTLDVSPMPVPLPGRVLVQLDANVTQAIPNNLNVKLRLHKKILGYKVLIPRCLDSKLNFHPYAFPNKKGFCTYRDVPTCMLTGAFLGCPVYQRHYNVHNVVQLADPGRLNRIVIAGDYSATIRIHDPTTKELLLCLKADFSIANNRR